MSLKECPTQTKRVSTLGPLWVFKSYSENFENFGLNNIINVDVPFSLEWGFMLKFYKYIWNKQKKKKVGIGTVLVQMWDTERSDSVVKYKLLICYSTTAAQKHSSPCCRSVLWRGYHHWPSSLQHFFEAIVKASKKHVLIKNWFEMSALWEEVPVQLAGFFFFFFSSTRGLKPSWSGRKPWGKEAKSLTGLWTS